jgi:hypothetical protein
MKKPAHTTEIRINRRLAPKVYLGMERMEAVFILKYKENDFIVRGIILQVLPYHLKVQTSLRDDYVTIHKSCVLAIDMTSNRIGKPDHGDNLAHYLSDGEAPLC